MDTCDVASGLIMKVLVMVVWLRFCSLQFGLPDPEGLKKKAVWVDCGIHAREWIAPAFCQWFVKEVHM